MKVRLTIIGVYYHHAQTNAEAIPATSAACVPAAVTGHYLLWRGERAKRRGGRRAQGGWGGVWAVLVHGPVLRRLVGRWPRDVTGWSWTPGWRRLVGLDP